MDPIHSAKLQKIILLLKSKAQIVARRFFEDFLCGDTVVDQEILNLLGFFNSIIFFYI